jgi:hypothetical protein
VARPTLSGNMNFFFYKFPLFCDNMDNFVHNAANKTSEFDPNAVVVPNKIVGNIWLQLGDKCSSREHLRIPESHPYSNICKVKLTI